MAFFICYLKFSLEITWLKSDLLLPNIFRDN